MNAPPLPRAARALVLGAILAAAGAFWLLAAPARASDPEPATVPGLIQAPPGPWGDLQYWEVWLEPPDRLIHASGYLEEPVAWQLPPATDQALRVFFLERGLTPEQTELLFREGIITREPGLMTVEAPDAIIDALSPATRARLHEALGAIPGNRFQAKPFALGGNTVPLLAAALPHRLPAGLIERAAALTYRVGPENVFADFPRLARSLPDPRSRMDFAKLLLRERSFMARILISPDTDLAGLQDYWTTGERSRDFLPILESVAESSETAELDIVHLLPPVPRMLLYTYPREDASEGGDYPDCFWTAFNFFEQEISHRHLDHPDSRLFGTRWLPVEPPLRFGDLIAVFNLSTGEAIHAASYIGGDLVFTKNGLSLMRPFVIEDMEGMLDNYHAEGLTEVKIFRHRRHLGANR